MSMDDVSEAVDALVADVPDMPASPYHHEYAIPSRSATPTIPPGFDLPHAHPSPLSREEPISQPISQPVSAKTPSLPAAAVAQATTPTRNIAHLASSHVPRVATPLSTVSVPPSPTPVPAVIVLKKATASAKSQSKDKAKEEVKTLATDSGLSKAIASQAAQKIVTQAAKPDEDFPTLGSEKTKARAKEVSIPSAPKAMTAKAVAKKPASASTSKETPAATPAAAPPPAATKPATTKKSTPGILNIIVPSPVKEQPTSTKAAASAAKPAVESSAFPPLPPSAPVSSTISTSAKGPKTLRVVATPKAETPSATITPPLSAVLIHPLSMPATRQPSIVSSTPASDIISDNASHTSASVSRPCSPPPTRIGSAPVRTKTKSQLKKARREAMREMTEQELAAVEYPEVEEIGPIMGRKKKQKKPKADNAPLPKAAASRPETPKAAEKIEVEKTREVTASADNSKKTASPTTDAISKAEDSKVKAKSKAKAEELVLPEPPAPSAEHEDENAEKPIPSPGTVLRDLYTHGEIAEPNTLAILNAPPGYNHRSEFRGDIQELDGKLVITEEDRADLIAAKPVRKEQGHNRIMLTPNGDCVRNLTPQEEDRYLQLQQRIAEESGPTQFVPARHNATNGFTLIGGRAVPNGPPTFFPPLDGTHPNGPMDPVSKIQRDEALSYINQYVLPSLSTNSQLERALNANALDTEMLRPADPQTWASWGQQGQNQGANPDSRSAQETPYGGNRQDGILASGLESMTAHFAVGRENARGGQPLGNVTLLSLPDAESALQAARKETDKLEKSFNQMMKKNRRLLLGGH